MRSRQSPTFNGPSWPKANGKDAPISRVDWHNHGRPWDHPDIHQHSYTYDSSSMSSKEGPPTYFSGVK